MQHRLLVGLAAALALLASGCRSGCCPRATLPAPGPTVVEVARSPDLQVLLEVFLLEVSETRLAAHLPPGTDGTGSERVLSAEQAATFLGGVRADSTGELIAMPSIVTTSAEDAIVEVRDAEPAGRWSCMKVVVTPRVLSGRALVELDVLALRLAPQGATTAHHRVQARAARLRSQETLILLGAPDATTGRRFIATVQPTILPLRVD